MKYTDFMKLLHEYYGGYPDNSKVPSYVMSYLNRYIREDKLKRLFQFITFSHPVRKGAPDISDIEKAIYLGLRNGKGDDVHKTKRQQTIEELPDFDEIEYEKGSKMLKDEGGLNAILNKAIKKVHKK